MYDKDELIELLKNNEEVFFSLFENNDRYYYEIDHDKYYDNMVYCVADFCRKNKTKHSKYLYILALICYMNAINSTSDTKFNHIYNCRDYLDMGIRRGYIKCIYLRIYSHWIFRKKQSSNIKLKDCLRIGVKLGDANCMSIYGNMLISEKKYNNGYKLCKKAIELNARDPSAIEGLITYHIWINDKENILKYNEMYRNNYNYKTHNYRVIEYLCDNGHFMDVYKMIKNDDCLDMYKYPILRKYVCRYDYVCKVYKLLCPTGYKLNYKNMFWLYQCQKMICKINRILLFLKN